MKVEKEEIDSMVEDMVAAIGFIKEEFSRLQSKIIIFGENHGPHSVLSITSSMAENLKRLELQIARDNGINSAQIWKNTIPLEDP